MRVAIGGSCIKRDLSLNVMFGCLGLTIHKRMCEQKIEDGRNFEDEVELLPVHMFRK